MEDMQLKGKEEDWIIKVLQRAQHHRNPSNVLDNSSTLINSLLPLRWHKTNQGYSSRSHFFRDSLALLKCLVASICSFLLILPNLFVTYVKLYPMFLATKNKVDECTYETKIYACIINTKTQQNMRSWKLTSYDLRIRGLYFFIHSFSHSFSVCDSMNIQLHRWHKIKCLTNLLVDANMVLMYAPQSK